MNKQNSAKNIGLNSTPDPMMAYYAKDVKTLGIQDRQKQRESLEKIAKEEEAIVDTILKNLDGESKYANRLVVLYNNKNIKGSYDIDQHMCGDPSICYGFRGNKKADREINKHIRISERGRTWMNHLVSTRREFMSEKDADEISIRLINLERMKKEFVSLNLRLVMNLAYNMKRAPKFLKISDLVQEGNIGLIKALDRFDYEKGYAFSTYACWWIKHYMRRSMEDMEKNVRVPVHVTELNNKVLRFEWKFSSKHGRDPTVSEIAEALDASEISVRRTQLNRIAREINLETPIGEDNSLYDVIPDTNVPDVIQNISGSVHKNKVYKLLTMLSPMQSVVIRKRFGLDGSKEETLKEIADPFEVSRERIRQIEALAISRFKKLLKNHYDMEEFS